MLDKHTIESIAEDLEYYLTNPVDITLTSLSRLSDLVD